MSFSLNNVVPWGRSFDEYLAMFALDERDLARSMLGCGDGPASFNAIATQRGCRVTSVDPIFQFSKDEIARRIDETTPTIVDQTRRNADEFVWTYIRSVDELIDARMTAMRIFLEDYPSGRGARYRAGSLPELPFENKQFEIALCSHFLFLYSKQYDAEFHLRSVLEMTRVAEEVRIFPLLALGSQQSPHVGPVASALREQGFRVDRVRVPYEFQKGGNEMLRITAL